MSTYANIPNKAHLYYSLFLGSVLIVFIMPSQGWLDGSELVSGANLLGVSHPPGQPLYSMLAKLFLLIPVGSMPFRANLFSAFLLLLSFIAFQSFIDKAMKGHRAEDKKVIGGVISIYLFLTFSFMVQGIRAELYSLNLLAVVLIMSCFGQRKLFMAGFFIAGLAGGCHPLLIAGLIPGIIIFSYNKKSWARDYLKGGFFFLIGISIYLYLPIRSYVHPLYDFGTPRDIASFLWTVSCKLYKAYDTLNPAGFLSNSADIFKLLGNELQYPFFAMSLLGLAFHLKRETKEALGLFAVFAVNFSIVASNSFYISENPDQAGYLMISFLVIAAFAVRLVLEANALIRGRLSTKGVACVRITVCAGAVLLIIGQILNLAGSRSRAYGYSAHSFSKKIIEGLPSHSVVFAGSFSTFSNLTNLVYNERFRNDLIILYSGFPDTGGYREDLSVNYPGFTELIKGMPLEPAPELMAKISSGGLSPFLELSLKKRAMKYGNRYDDRLLEIMGLHGWFLRLGGVRSAQAIEEWKMFWDEMLLVYETNPDDEFRKNLLLSIFLQGDYLARMGLKEELAWLISKGERLDPGFDGLAELRARF